VLEVVLEVELEAKVTLEVKVKLEVVLEVKITLEVKVEVRSFSDPCVSAVVSCSEGHTAVFWIR